MPEGVEARAFEVRADVARWLAHRHIRAVAEIDESSAGPCVRLRPVQPDGLPDPGRVTETFDLNELTAPEPLRAIVRRLSSDGWFDGPVRASDGSSADLWCAPV